uniref:Uncharacterized protein n=1 Tax=Dulem virus 32 TaxID=3145750 RepID=A0AAU8B188_9CAUD
MTLPVNQKCSWCGHLAHSENCPREIQVSDGKKPIHEPCPCNRHRHPLPQKKEGKHDPGTASTTH